MKSALISALVLLTAPAMAHDPDRVINRASELVSWCKEEAEAYYIGQGAEPYQWTASYHDRANVLIVNGTLRVDSKTVPVTCRIARGAREQYASIEFGED